MVRFPAMVRRVSFVAVAMVALAAYWLLVGAPARSRRAQPAPPAPPPVRHAPPPKTGDRVAGTAAGATVVRLARPGLADLEVDVGPDGAFDFGAVPRGRYGISASAPAKLADDRMLDLRDDAGRRAAGSLRLAVGACEN